LCLVPPPCALRAGEQPPRHARGYTACLACLACAACRSVPQPVPRAALYTHALPTCAANRQQPGACTVHRCTVHRCISVSEIQPRCTVHRMLLLAPRMEEQSCSTALPRASWRDLELGWGFKDCKPGYTGGSNSDAGMDARNRTSRQATTGGSTIPGHARATSK
jgi:hypothetical protein